MIGSAPPHKLMNRIGWKIAAVAFIASTLAAGAGEWDNGAARNCTWCRGTSGQGYTVAPRLAGQRPSYVESQMRSFHAHVRDNPLSRQYMWDAVASLDPRSVRDLALYFSAIPPKPANDGNPGLADQGRTIYLEGIPEANIVSCYACHGPNAEGVREIPRLGGLAYFYLKARLEQWGQGYHSTPGSPMPYVASQLGPSEIDALASYLSFVK
jgi:cytochrome c553